jgi:hypothetical protein
MSSFRTLLLRIFYIIVVAAAIIAISELSARAMYKHPYLTGLFKDDNIFHHMPPPYYKGGMQSDGDFDLPFTTNNKGMRGPGDYTYDKDPGVFRIAVLGDSFMFGVGVKADETFSSVLEKMLNGASDGAEKYQVYNFGVNSFSPLLEYIYIKREVIRYEPDMVILMLDLCDIQDDYFYEPHIVKDASGDIIGCDPFKVNGLPDLKSVVMRHSRLYFMLDQKLFQSFRKMRTIGFRRYFENKFKKVRNKTEILINKEIDNIEFDRFLFVREGKDKAIVMRHWERTAKYLLMIKKYLDLKGIRLVMATYPYSHQVGERQWDKGRVYWAFERNRVYDPGAAFAIVEDFANKNGIEFINVYDALRARKDEPLYFARDGHWTKLGQKTAAEAVYDSPLFRKGLK